MTRSTKIRISVVTLLLLVVSSCGFGVELTPGQSVTTTCTDATYLDGLDLDGQDGVIYVSCGGVLEATYRCPAGEISATQVSPSEVLVECDEVVVPAPLWHADADIDVDNVDETLFLDKETPGLPFTRLSIVDDPQGLFGKVYQAELQLGDIALGFDRAEWAKAYLGDGSTVLNLWGTNGPPSTDIYIGWRSLFGGDITLNGGSSEGNFAQWKGNSSCGGPAVGWTIRNNRLSIRTLDWGDDPDDHPGAALAWTDATLLADRIGVWTDYVMRVNFAKFAEGTGFIEFWINGVQQTMSDGTLRHEGPTVCPDDAWVYPKFGVYSMNSGAPIHWLESPRIGLSFESVEPQ